MKIKIPLQRDSFNTYSNFNLEVEEGCDVKKFAVSLSVDGGNGDEGQRFVEVDARALYRALYALYGDSLKNRN